MLKEVYFQIVEGFYGLLTDLNSKTEMKLFLNDFFTKTEKVMLAKRLAIALMVMKGYDTKIVVEILRVSSATVYHTKDWLETGKSGLKIGLKND